LVWNIELASEQLKNIKKEIEDYIKKSDDFVKSEDTLLSVKIDQFAASSIDIRLICFTKTKHFQEWLNVKDTLALEIKNIVEKNKASFAFPKHICLCGEKFMKSVLILFDNVITLYIWILIINAVISWLVAFNILNTGNRFVYAVLDFSYRLTSPALNYIRRFLPNLGSIDISPVILILALMFLRNFVFEMFAPSLF
jgi:YggT family protein